MKLGWIPDAPDKRDLYLAVTPSAVPLPAQVDLDLSSFHYDQLDLGSCTANAVSALFQFRELEQDGSAPVPSRLALYYWTRLLQKTVDHDSGATLRGTIKAAVKYGMGPESLWRYDVSRFKKQPNAKFIAEAAKHKVKKTEYARVPQTLSSLRKTLADGHPIVFGFTVYESFMSEAVAKTGVVPMPKPDERADGGHAVILTGYCDKRQAFRVKNSWGKSWGDKGYCWMPYDMITDSNISDDFWTIYEVSPLTP